MKDEVLKSFIYNNPTKIFFGAGKLEMLHTEPLPGSKALILTSKGSSHIKSGVLSKTLEELKKSDVDYIICNNVQENPLKENCEEAGYLAKKKGCDFVLAIGGGAVLDSAVPVAILATNSGDLWDYVFGGTGKCITAPNKPLPIVTIPTTSGTGSEINECGVISNEDTHEKIGMSDKRCKPVLSVVDPLYMRTVPPLYTAYQGFDALFHHIEVIISQKCNMLSQIIALSSIEKIFKYLPIAVEDGYNLEAREEVAFAATMSGITMQLSRITAQHSIEHAMSAYHRNLPHGAGLIIISKEFSKFFIDRHLIDDRYIMIAKAMGYPESNNPYDFLQALEELKIKCKVNDIAMSSFGISVDEFPSFAKMSRILQGGGFEVLPCELSDDDIINILKNSYV